MSEVDSDEVHTAVWSPVVVPLEAAEEAKENPRVIALEDGLVEQYPRHFNGLAHGSPPDPEDFGQQRSS